MYRHAELVSASHETLNCIIGGAKRVQGDKKTQHSQL